MNKPDWASRPLITARCGHCHRVAAKYFEHDGQGHWVWQRQDDTATERVCSCDPPPALPDGDELQHWLVPAKHPARYFFGRRSYARFTIRVV
jgi:hypothetical protein